MKECYTLEQFQHSRTLILNINQVVKISLVSVVVSAIP